MNKGGRIINAFDMYPYNLHNVQWCRDGKKLHSGFDGIDYYEMRGMCVASHILAQIQYKANGCVFVSVVRNH